MLVVCLVCCTCCSPLSAASSAAWWHACLAAITLEYQADKLQLCWYLAAQEYADFIKQVEVDSAAAAQQQAAEEEEEAAGRREREDFEQL